MQFHTAIDISLSRMEISHCYWHLVVKNGNWQIYPQMHHGIYIMGCIWQPFWILQEKVGISCYFSIIRVVNTQLALYIHVRCNPLDTQHPQTTPKHPHMIITNFNYESSYLPCVICNIVVKADLGRCPGRCTPQNNNYKFQLWGVIFARFNM